jgi:hypothetical protein
MTTVQNSVPDEVRCDHLILLVGGNPLPNYVAARILGKQEGTLHLVHTQKTYRIAQRLAGQLKQRAENSQLAGEFKITFVQVSEDNPSDIFDKVKALAGQRDGRVGLNYTGGNRPMSVHAYGAVAEARRDALFSYLDAGRLEMLVPRCQPRTCAGFRADQLLNMRLETLLRLQGLARRALKAVQELSRLQPELGCCFWLTYTRRMKGLKYWLNWRRRTVAMAGRSYRKTSQVWRRLRRFSASCAMETRLQTSVAHLLGHKTLPSTATVVEGWMAGRSYVLKNSKMRLLGAMIHVMP